MSGRAYVVQQLNWEYNDNWWYIQGEDAVVAYEDREMAELRQRELEDQARRRLGRSPARHAGWVGRASSRSEAEILEALRGWRLPLPPTRRGDAAEHDWYDDAWWSEILELVRDRPGSYWQRLKDPSLSAKELQHAASVSPDDLWALFDRVRFYEVVEVEIEAR